MKKSIFPEGISSSLLRSSRSPFFILPFSVLFAVSVILIQCKKEAFLSTPRLISESKQVKTKIEYIIQTKPGTDPKALVMRFTEYELTPFKALILNDDSLWLMSALIEKGEETKLLQILKQDEDIIAVQINRTLNFH